MLAALAGSRWADLQDWAGSEAGAPGASQWVREAAEYWAPVEGG